jgi:hypothetical protein
VPFAGKADVVLDKTASPPTITCGDVTHDGIALQDLYDAIREWEDDLPNIDILPSDGAESSILDGSGKEGLGLGAFRPITMVINAPWVVQAGDHTATPLDVFTFDGGTLISDDEAADLATPRRPLQAAAGVTTYDRVKGQEGKFITADNLETKQDALQASFDTLEGRMLAKHGSDPVTGIFVIKDTVNLKQWEAPAWEDFAETTVYKGDGLDHVGQLVEVPYVP